MGEMPGTIGFFFDGFQVQRSNGLGKRRRRI
jgi:hypothetical protein